MLSLSDLCSSSPQTPEEMESRNKLLRLLDSVIDALVWAISKLGLSTQQQTLRLGHLTMLLSHIRHVRYRDDRKLCLSQWKLNINRFYIICGVTLSAATKAWTICPL